MFLILSLLLLLLFPDGSAAITQMVGCGLDGHHRERADHPLVDDAAGVLMCSSHPASRR